MRLEPEIKLKDVGSKDKNTGEDDLQMLLSAPWPDCATGSVGTYFTVGATTFEVIVRVAGIVCKSRREVKEMVETKWKRSQTRRGGL